MDEVTLIDAGTGNLRSVHKALLHLGAKVLVTSEPDDVLAASKVILPGVGAFGDFMRGLSERRLIPALEAVVEHDVPLFGICVGMQALFAVSEEMGEHKGLGLLPGRVVRFPSSPGLKVPHTGWNGLDFTRDCSLWKGLEPGDQAYFNHAYYCLPEKDTDVAALTGYGFPFASAVWRGNIFGVQFHPEKSQRVGLTLLGNFLAL